MKIIMPKPSNNLQENDLLAIAKDNKFIGYATVLTILTDEIILDVSKTIAQTFNELQGEKIPYSFKIN